MSDSINLRQQVAWSCRILAMHGHADMTLGHVSIRGPDNLIYIKRKDIGLDEVTPDDVIGIDLDNNVVWGKGDNHLEAVLHTEVYRVREDVGAVVHTHPPHSIALGATTTEFKYLNHDAFLFHDGLSYFGDTAGLINNTNLGKMVAKALDTRRVVLMRNHGVLVVGKDIPWATYTALTLERAAMLQSLSENLGNLSPLSQETAAHLFKEKYRDEFITSYWHYLIRKIKRVGLADGMPDYE